MSRPSRKNRSAHAKGQHNKSTPSLISGMIAFFKILVGLIVTVGGLFGAYFLFVPNIIQSLTLPQNSEFPFEIFINITNSGYFDISNVETIPNDFKYSANIKQPLTMYTHDSNKRVTGEKPPQIEKIKRNHSEKIDLSKMLGLLANRTEAASFSITITYKVGYLPFKFSQKHYYKLHRTITGAYEWGEISPKEAG